MYLENGFGNLYWFSIMSMQAEGRTLTVRAAAKCFQKI